MLHVEAVIRMLEPGYDVTRIAARRRNTTNPHFKRGTVFRSALAVLRKATKPLTSRQIAEALFHERGIPKPSRHDLRNLIGGVHASLRNHEGKSVEAVGEGMPVKWRLKSDAGQE
jgi:hypothetical protein